MVHRGLGGHSLRGHHQRPGGAGRAAARGDPVRDLAKAKSRTCVDRWARCIRCDRYAVGVGHLPRRARFSPLRFHHRDCRTSHERRAEEDRTAVVLRAVPDWGRVPLDSRCNVRRAASSERRAGAMARSFSSFLDRSAVRLFFPLPIEAAAIHPSADAGNRPLRRSTLVRGTPRAARCRHRHDRIRPAALCCRAAGETAPRVCGHRSLRGDRRRRVCHRRWRDGAHRFPHVRTHRADAAGDRHSHRRESADECSRSAAFNEGIDRTASAVHRRRRSDRRRSVQRIDGLLPSRADRRRQSRRRGIHEQLPDTPLRAIRERQIDAARAVMAPASIRPQPAASLPRA